MQPKRFGRIVAGTALTGVGVASLALPILPGIVIIGAGLAVLAPEIPAAQRAVDRIRSLIHRSE
ncbi:MAG: PGPGW domain-containing protein [Acidimicrobiia bacterium]|nr:PGPGW domain-containing protein [Acidimicrobiia bacterium]MDH5421936.1 PGPGW domain-containing protein [Acidimicrobiia bacterium]MDH5502720.1 PGPGW domain-containing protein [Acidimicrobiia bacterium]